MKLGTPLYASFNDSDPIALRDYAQAVEGMGFDYLLFYEHLLDANPDAIFHEALTTMCYLAAVTERLELVSGVIVLPKRQAALVAKQAAQVDVLSGGRLRLGVGAGWNEKEFVAMNANFKQRGRLMDEQIAVMRRLWTERLVSYQGQFHTLNEVSINMPPVQQPIPIWIGGWSEAAIKRAARIGDGWMSYLEPDEFRQGVEKLHLYLDEQGRSRADFPISNPVFMGQTPAAEWGALLDEWRSLGVTHVEAAPPPSPGRAGMDACLKQLEVFKAETGL